MSKDLSNTSLIWPKDCDNINDLPVDLATAIEQALRINGWQENLTEDEIPPRWAWHLDWELEDWFIAVKNAREKKYGGNSNPDDHSSIPDDYDTWEENEYTARFK